MYKIFNPLTGVYSEKIEQSKLQDAYNLIIEQIKNNVSVVYDNTPYKKLFSDFLMAKNYFCTYLGEQIHTTGTLSEYLNAGAYQTYYEHSVLTLETGDIGRYFFHKCDNRILAVKIKDKKITDFYIQTNGSSHLWDQFNPESMEQEAYYQLEDINGVNTEKKFLVDGTVHSEYITQGFSNMPEDFKTLVNNYPFVQSKNILMWGVKPYGKVITFLEDFSNLLDDELAINVQPQVKVVNENLLKEIKNSITVVKVQVDDSGNEVWINFDVSTLQGPYADV